MSQEQADPLAAPILPTDIRKRPIRVPSLVPDRWIYLRAWSPLIGGSERTHGSSSWQVIVSLNGDIGAAIRIEGLEPVAFQQRGDIEAGIEAVDAYLLSIGAEPVPDAEWPDNCGQSGGTAIAKAPLLVQDWDLLEAEMRKRGYRGVFDLQARGPLL